MTTGATRSDDVSEGPAPARYCHRMLRHRTPRGDTARVLG